MGKVKSKKKTDNDALRKTGGIRFSKDKGQHILKNPLVVQTMIERAAIKSSDTVLEVGPGTGNLTVKLLEKANKVCAFEIDPRMVNELQKRVQGTSMKPKLQIYVGDVIKCKEWPKFDLCVANLPYQISSPFMIRLIECEKSYRCAVVMVQKEFADRMVAQPGDKLYCRLSANMQFHCKVNKLLKISKNSFRPPPKVDSAVVRVEPRHPKPPVSTQEYDGLLRVLFVRKNKTVVSNFTKAVMAVLRKNYLQLCQEVNREPLPEIVDAANGLQYVSDSVISLLTENGLNKLRARTMDEDDILRLLLVLKKSGYVFG